MTSIMTQKVLGNTNQVECDTVQSKVAQLLTHINVDATIDNIDRATKVVVRRFEDKYGASNETQNRIRTEPLDQLIKLLMTSIPYYTSRINEYSR